jgi:multicomponent Na+:H+ antiporter subunit D
MPDHLLPLLVVLSSLIPGLIIFALPQHAHRTRTVLNLTGATVKILLIAYMLWGVYNGRLFEHRFLVLPDLEFVLRADALAMLFVSLSAVLWLVTTIYAIGYLEGSPNRSRFFGFFSLCVSATVGIALAGNLFTFFIFYEALTLATYPLVVHRGTREALSAGRVYLGYTLGGGAVLLVGVVWLEVLAGPVEFTQGGAINHLPADQHGTLIVIFAVLIAGLGVKAALLPLHSWLPIAMVAPAPVSALLHAVAVVKAGAFGIVRVLYNVYGIEFAASLGVTLPLAILAAATILYGSLRALTQQDLKRRLAFSTVSQLSYIILGACLVGPTATIGGVVHLVHQGIMKITLFFCAGAMAETLGIRRVREMDGVGRRMPLTMIAFTAAAFGMIGLPPMAGFVSKWYLGAGALEVGQVWWLAVLVASSLLNAAYFLPVIYRAWFRPARGAWSEMHPRGRFETMPSLLFPTLFTALASLLAGLFAGSAVSPLEWVKLVMEREYRL